MITADRIPIPPGLGMVDGRPKYRQVADQLRAAIVNGRFAPGVLLPTEEQLTRLYQVSRVTIRSALALLRREGLISTRRGAGSTVTRTPTRSTGRR